MWPYVSSAEVGFDTQRSTAVWKLVLVRVSQLVLTEFVVVHPSTRTDLESSTAVVRSGNFISTGGGVDVRLSFTLKPGRAYHSLPSPPPVLSFLVPYWVVSSHPFKRPLLYFAKTWTM